MAKLTKSALLMKSQEQMFRLVNDVSAYPEFLPWCVGAAVITADSASMTASVTVGRGPMQHKFTTRNTLTPCDSILMTLVDGPFSQLTGEWLFKALGEDGCRVSLSLDYVLGNRLSAKATDAMLQRVSSEIVDAFVVRAGIIY